MKHYSVDWRATCCSATHLHRTLWGG